MAHIRIDITDPDNPTGSPLTTYWFINHINLDILNQAGEFHWFVYATVAGGGPVVSSQVLTPLRIGLDGAGYSDPTSSGFTLSLIWSDLLDVGVISMGALFDKAKLHTYRFNDENVDLSTGTEF